MNDTVDDHIHKGTGVSFRSPAMFSSSFSSISDAELLLMIFLYYSLHQQIQAGQKTFNYRT